MANKKMLDKHLKDLGQLEKILKEADISCKLIKSSETIPLNMLRVPMDADDKKRPRSFTCSFIPMDEEDLETSSLLQFYSELPLTTDPDRTGDLREFLMACNIIQPIGHFGMQDETTVYFRYVLVIKQSNKMDEDLIIETLMLFEYAINAYQDEIEDVATGAVGLGEALKGLEG
jgi:hypothetical protein